MLDIVYSLDSEQQMYRSERADTQIGLYIFCVFVVRNYTKQGFSCRGPLNIEEMNSSYAASLNIILTAAFGFSVCRNTPV